MSATDTRTPAPTAADPGSIVARLRNAPPPEPADRINLSRLRSVMRGWHERAVALGLDGVDDVLHNAEIAAKRNALALANTATQTERANESKEAP